MTPPHPRTRSALGIIAVALAVGIVAAAMGSWFVVVSMALVVVVQAVSFRRGR
jgi:hypothetical protein